MKRGIVLLFTLFLPAMGQFLVSRIDAGGRRIKVDLPIVEFLLKEEGKPSKEWEAFFAEESQTTLAARDLKIFWRRVEERTWWRVETQVNMAIPFALRDDYFETCIVRKGDLFKGLVGGITAKEPTVKTHVLEDHVDKSFWKLKPEGFGNVYPKTDLSFTDEGLPPPGTVPIPIYPFPRVNASEFCESGWRPFFWIPGVMIVIHVNKNLPIPPIVIPIPPNWPHPIYFPEGVVKNRFKEAIAHANTKYQADYWSNVLTGKYVQVGRNAPEALSLPLRIPQALWFGGPRSEGLLAIQPSGNLKPDPGSLAKRAQQFFNLAERLRDGGYKVRKKCPSDEENCEEDAGQKWKFSHDYKDPVAYLYYAQLLGRDIPLTKDITHLSLESYLLPDFDHKLDQKGPGIWKLEEAKRWLEESVDPFLGERQGVVTLFQTWVQWDTVILPIPISFHGYAILTEVTLIPRSINSQLVPWEYPLGPVTITGPRVHFGWVNVPEGYSVPRAKGEPSFTAPRP